MNKNDLMCLGLIASVVTCATVYEICKSKREREANYIMSKAKLDAALFAREAMEQEHKERMKQIEEDYLKREEERKREHEEWMKNFKQKLHGYEVFLEKTKPE